MGLSSSQPPKIETVTLIQSDYFTEKPSLAAIAFQDKDKTALIELLPKSRKTRFLQSNKDWLKLLREKHDLDDLMLIFDFQSDDMESIIDSALLYSGQGVTGTVKKIFFLKTEILAAKTKFDCVVHAPSSQKQSFTVIHRNGLVEQIQLEEKEKELEFVR